MYTGDDGVYTFTFEHQRKPDCPVCGNQTIKLEVRHEMTLQQLIDLLMDRSDLQLKKPSLRSASKSLFMQAPKALLDATTPNLSKPLADLLAKGGEELTVTDQSLPFSLQIQVSFPSQ